MIGRHQRLQENCKLYICDLHFNQNDIRQTDKKCVLQRNAKPFIMYVLLGITVLDSSNTLAIKPKIMEFYLYNYLTYER